jgi:hypothetical protein
MPIVDQIGENPVFFALLQVCDLGCGQLGALQVASEEDGNHGVVTLAAEYRTVEDGKSARPCSAVSQLPTRVAWFSQPPEILPDVWSQMPPHLQ